MLLQLANKKITKSKCKGGVYAGQFFTTQPVLREIYPICHPLFLTNPRSHDTYIIIRNKRTHAKSFPVLGMSNASAWAKPQSFKTPSHRAGGEVIAIIKQDKTRQDVPLPACLLC